MNTPSAARDQAALELVLDWATNGHTSAMDCHRASLRLDAEVDAAESTGCPLPADVQDVLLGVILWLTDFTDASGTRPPGATIQ